LTPRRIDPHQWPATASEWLRCNFMGWIARRIDIYQNAWAPLADKLFI
jgi:hypothetical protein